MSESSLAVARVRLRVSRGSATATGPDSELSSRGNIVVPSSVFVPSLAATVWVTRIGDRAFQECPIKSIAIPHHVQILCSYCFPYCKSLSSISFEKDSELARFESCAFYCCLSLKSITIPRHVQILCSSCFSYCFSFSSISFENDSELTCVQSKAFRWSSLKSVTIPRHVQILCSECFSSCYSLLSVSFENDSELIRIEAGACGWINLFWVIVLESTLFIACDAFPPFCAVTLAGSDCGAEFRTWNK
jgi:hypothetical protein